MSNLWSFTLTTLFLGSLGAGFASPELESSPSCKDECKRVATAINKSANAVVNLYVTQINDQVFNPFIDDPFFGAFFKGMIQSRPQVLQGSGSGVILKKEGLLVTCAHVVANAKKIKVKLKDGREFDGKTTYINEKLDIAFVSIIREHDEDLPVADIADSSSLIVTEDIYLVGNAFGIGQSITKGIVSAVDRIVDGKVLFQTDAAANPGNSGGGAFLSDGRYIGSPNAIISKTGANHGVGLVIPSNLILGILHKIENKTVDKKLWVGLSLQNLTYDLAKGFDGFDLKNYQGGCIVKKVLKDSPFESLLKRDDIILSINKVPVDHKEMLNYFLMINPVDAKMTIRFWRKNEGIKEVSALPIEKSKTLDAADNLVLEGEHILKGSTLKEVDVSVNGQAPEKRVAIELSKEAIAAGFPIDRGGIILELNGNDVHSVEEAVNLLEQGLSSVTIATKNGNFTFRQNNIK